MKKIVIIILFFGLAWNSTAQQMGSFSQTIENKYLINPAVVGSDNTMPVFLGYKRLWTGINAAPSTQMLTFHMKLDDKLGGVGAKVFNYSTGHLSKAGLNLSYAYHLDLNDDLKLSFGLSGALYQVHLDKSALKLEDANDVAITNSVEKLIVPDANFGAYLYSDNYYVGISSLQLFGRRVDLLNDNLDFNQERHYFLNAGYIFELQNDFKLEPSTLVKYVESNFGQWDLYLKTTYKDMVWFGLGYRSDFDFAPNDVIISLGVQKENIKLGYAFDYNMTSLGAHSNGTHEIIFMYMFGKTNNSAYKW